MNLTALYGRQSLDRKNNAEAVARQIKSQHALCDANGWDDRREYVDNNLSATKGGPRPSYQQLMADVAAGLVKRIIVFHLSRFWRNRKERAEGIEILQKHRVVLVCVEGPTIDCTNAYGRGMAAMLGEVDTLEVDLKGERQNEANEDRAKDGLPHTGGPRAFGYERDGLTVVPAEAEAVREAYAQILSGGSLRSIAKQWTEADLLTDRQRKTGKTWRFTSVSDVLKNPRYAGIRNYHGVEYKAKWPALVTEDVYRAVCAILTDPNRRPTGSYGVALLSTVALCGVCGSHVFSGGGHLRGKNVGEGKRYRSYTCAANPSRHIRRKAEPIDDLVVSLVIGRLSAPDAVSLFTKRNEVDLPRLITERTAIGERQRVLAEQFADGSMTPAMVKTASERLARRLADIDSQITAASRQSALQPLVTGEDVGEVWARLDVDRQRAVISELFEVVELLPVGRGTRIFRPESVRIEWRRDED